MTSWAEELARRGWAVLQDASSNEVASQLGRASSSTRLEPKDRGDARPWSLSGIYGLGAFPWHTDGAISSNPPRWLLLRAIELSGATWTDLLSPDTDVLVGLRRTTLRAVDRVGRVSYLPAMVTLGDGRMRVRWDPRTCTPRTGLTVDIVQCQVPTVRVEWQVGQLLVIDNFRVMHRRPAVHGQTRRLLERPYAWDR